MKIGKNQSIKRKKIIITLIFTALLVYLAYHALQGNRGIINLFKLSQEKKQLEQEMIYLHKERDSVQKKISRMQSESIDLDFLEEQVKKNLGYIEKSEKAYSYQENSS